jgi:hypothetical protein
MRRIAPQLRLIRRRSWGSNASTLRRFHPLDGTTMAFPQRRPRESFDQPVPAPTVFVGRPVCPALHLSCIGRLRRIEDVVARDLGARSPVEDPTDPIPRDRSILPWALSSCRVADASGTAAWAPRQQFWRATSVVSSPRVIRQSPARSSRAHPLLGLRRPSCADVTGISSGCIHLHGAVSAWLRRRRPFSVL